MDFVDIENIRWKYINEGNLHIVIEIVGTDLVLRLIKKDDQSLDLEYIDNAVNFVNIIVLPLLRQDENLKVKIVRIRENTAAKLMKELSVYRPKDRLIKSNISSYAVMAPNLAKWSDNCEVNFCIEIKPKQGFISNLLTGYKKCIYCLKQYSKLKKGQITSVSAYCPLDLFSGDKYRMSKAIYNLLSNPQNNLNFFKNSDVVFNDQCSEKQILINILKYIPAFNGSIDIFVEFIVEILSKEPDKLSVIDEKNMITIKNLSDHKEDCMEGNSLNKNSILDQILQLQLLSKYVVCQDISDINDYEYIPLVLDLISSKKLNLYEHKDREVFLSICPPLYLAVISSIVKDCSIMISFSETNDDVTGCHVAVINNYKMYYKVGVTDLEPKPLSTLLKRDNYEKKLLEVYNNMCPKHTNSEMSVRVAQNWFKHLQSSDFDVKDEPHSGRHVTDKDDPILEKVEIQPHTETKAKQLDAWQQLIVDYLKATKQSAIDIREIQSTPLFNNTSINRKLSQESILIILEDMAKKGKAAPVDKSKMVWEIYWHSLDEWGNMLYSWACNNGMNNAVCTIFELREGDNTVDEEFHSLDMNVLLKALKNLEAKGKCELMEFDDNQGVKFF